jgi:hypothetical protein
MAKTPNAFDDRFKKLLEEFPDGFSLAQCQFLYQQVILKMGTLVLERFQQDAIGPDPFKRSGGGGGGVKREQQMGGDPSGPTAQQIGGSQPAGGGSGPREVPAGGGGGGGPGLGGHPSLVVALVVLNLPVKKP